MQVVLGTRRLDEVTHARGSIHLMQGYLSSDARYLPISCKVTGMIRAEYMTHQWLVIRHGIHIESGAQEEDPAIKGNTLIMHVFEHFSHLRA